MNRGALAITLVFVGLGVLSVLIDAIGSWIARPRLTKREADLLDERQQSEVHITDEALAELRRRYAGNGSKWRKQRRREMRRKGRQ